MWFGCWGCDHVGRFPVIGERAFCTGVGSEGGNAAVLYGTRVYCGGSHGHSKNDHVLSDLVFASASGLHRVGDLVGSSGSIGVRHILFVTFFSVSEVPMIVGECLSRGIGGGGAGEFGGGAKASSGGFKVGDGLGIYEDLGCARGGLSIDGCDTSVDTTHFVGAIGNGGILCV